MRAVRVLALAALVAQSLAADFTLHMFDAARFPNAQCNDGTMSGMYVRTSPTGSATWVIFLEGA
jgi:hypothetical protein